MPLPITWSPELDYALRRMRLDGVSWDNIAHAFGVSRNSAFTRGRCLGFGNNPLPMPAAPRPALPAVRVPVIDRPPLPPGDPVTWGAITDGTLLEGATYPVWTLERIAAGDDAC
ncbi:MAG TPA: AsnC family protein [Acetobacteraceae bacterium]|nr:AsnC family protein [Acetobacteraceae bacterium]